MTLPIYPLAVRGVRWPKMKTSDFDTIVQSAANKYETRIENTQNPIWHWNWFYEYLKDNPQDLVAALSPHTDYRYLQGFILQQQGRFAEFLFDDLSDDMIGARSQQNGSATNPSSFQPAIYPTQPSSYNAGTYVVDNNAVPHLQKVIIGGIPGATVPSFSTIGGTTVSGQVTFSDQGAFSGALAGALATVSDATDPISAATPGSSAGSGFAVGDYLLVTGGGGTGGILQVATITSLGVILSFSVFAGGSGYTTASNVALAILSGAGIGSPNADITASTIYYSPIQRNFGGQFMEDVTDLNLIVYPATVWDNGTIKTPISDYTIGGPGLAIPGASYQGLYIQWAAQPTTPVTMLAQFYFRVCFESDQQDIEQFMQQLWTIGGESSKNGSGQLKIISSRVALV